MNVVLIDYFLSLLRLIRRGPIWNDGEEPDTAKPCISINSRSQGTSSTRSYRYPHPVRSQCRSRQPLDRHCSQCSQRLPVHHPSSPPSQHLAPPASSSVVLEP